MSDMNDETNELIDNAAADLINASAKEQADELRNEAQGTMDAENSAIQQNTALLNANTQAQKALNDEKQKTLTYQQAIDNAIQESLKQRNEMMVYHGSGSEFKKFSDSKINSGVGGQLFGNGHYFSENKTLASSYAKEYDKPVTYFAAIPKDNGSNYVDWDKKYNISELLGRLSESTKLLLGNLGKVDDTAQLISGRKLVERLQRINLDRTVLPEMGFTGVKYPTASGRDNNYTVYSPEDIRVIKREVLNQPNNSPYYNPITYVDESLKSAIENSNFDGARFFFDISEAIKNKLISGVNANAIASGSFVLGPSLSAADVHKVNDFIVTDDGQIFETDIKDTIIATKNPELLGLQGGQLIKNGEGNAVGILSQQDAELLTTTLNRMREFEKMFLPETLSTHSDYQQLKSATSSLVGKSINNLSFGRSNGLSLLNAQVASQVNQWTPPRSQGFDISNGNSVLNSTDSLELFQRNADRRFLEQQRLERSRSVLMGSYSMSDDAVLLNEFFDKLDIFNNLPPLEKVKHAKSMMQEIAAIEEVINASPEFSGKIDFTGIKNVFMAQSLGGFGTRMATYNQPVLNSSGYRDEDYAFWEDRRRRERNNYLQRETFREIPNETINRWRDDDDALVNSRRKANYDRLKGEAKVILTDVEAVEASLPVIKTLYKSMSKFAHIAGDTLHDKFATQEQIRFATDFQNKSLEYGKFGDFNPVYYTNAKGQFTDASGNVLQNQAAPIQKTDKFGLPMFDFTGSGLLGEFQQKKHIIDEVTKALLDENITEQDRAKLIEKLKEESEGYNDIVNKLSSDMKELNDSSRETASKLNLYKQNPYLSAKYALRRTDQQQEEFREDNPFAFSTTGSMRESFLKTFFNKSVGYRQQQGLTGFLANVGYNKSGTLLSIELGILGKAVKDAGRAMLQFSKESVQAYGELQSIKTNLGIVYSSQAEANQTFNEIAEYSVKSPFGVQTVSEYAVLLKQSGIYASDLMDTLKQIGDVAGGNQQKFANIANAFSQIEANGKATTRQLRQFATAGIPIYKELSKELNVGVEQIRKMTEEGKISSAVIEKIFSNMTGEGGTFENAVNIGAKTWKARQQNLADAKQLSQAAFGETLINLGGTGRGDSLAEQFLSLKETIYDVVKNTATLHNIKKSVNNIENQNLILKQLDEQIAALEAAGGNEELLESLKKQRVEAAAVISPDMQRSIYENAYKNAKKDLDAAVLETSERYKQASREADENRKYGYVVVDKDGNITPSAENSELAEKYNWQSFTRNEVIAGRAKYEAAQEIVNNGVTEKEYRKLEQEVEKYRNLAFAARAISIFSTGNETLDKAINKDDKSLYLLKQKSDAAYKNTTKGKFEEEEKKRQEWDSKLDLYDEYAPFVSESGQLLKTFKGTIEDAVTIFKSGIITPLNKIDLRPEKLATDDNLYLSEKQKAERKKEWATFQNNLLTQIDTVLQTSDLGDGAKTELLNFRNNLFDHHGPASVLKEAKFDKIIETLDAFTELTEKFSASGLDDIVELLSFAVNDSIKTGRPEDYYTANATKDIFPLWQRILNSTLGVDLKYFKEGAIKNGKQAVDLFEQQGQRDIIKNTMKAMLSTKSLADVSGNIIYKNPIESLYTGNNSKDGTLTVNWKKTADAMRIAATDLKASAEETRAYSDSLQSQLDTINSAFADMLTITESAENIYDPQFQKELGPYLKKLEASGINTFDLAAIKAANDIDEFRESSVNALNTLKKNLTEISSTVGVLAEFKGSVKNLSNEINMIKIRGDIYSGKYSDKPLFKGLSNESVEGFLSKVEELKENPLYAEILNDKYLDAIYNKSVSDNINNIKQERNIAESDVKAKKDEWEKNNDLTFRSFTLKKDTLQSNYDKASTLLEEGLKKQDEIETLKNTAEIALQKAPGSAAPSIKQWIAKYEDELAAIDIPQLTANKNKALAELNGLQTPEIVPEPEGLDANTDALLKLNDIMVKYIQFYFEKDPASERTKNLELIYNTTSGRDENGEYTDFAKANRIDTWRSIAAGTTVYKDNNGNEQKALNFIGAPAGTVMSDFIRKSYFDTDGKTFNNSKALNTLIERTDDEIIKKAFGGKAFDKDGNVKSAEEIFADKNGDITVDSVSANFTKLKRAEEQAKNLRTTFTSVGESMKNAFSQGITDGFNKSLRTLGSSIKDLSHYGDDLANTWAGIGQQMMDAIGPAMTNAGLSLIQDGQYGAGLALIAAGGVAQFAAGLFESAQKDDQREKKLQNLKDLLSDIIDQARTDAEYYQRNLLHTQALSEADALSTTHSVHDAIIAPNGNVISTDPEDYLIATKTPGNYANLGGGNSSVVNFTLIDQSTGVEVKSVNKNQNADGSIDITAVLISKVSKAITDGEFDDAFEARDIRMAGKSYAY